MEELLSQLLNFFKKQPINFHGHNKTKSFFEGWYFKQQNNSNAISFIPGINIDKYGNKSAFIQIITNDNAYNIDYPFEQFKAHKNKLCIKIGDNVFTKKGIKINIKNNDVCIKGKLLYGKFNPIKYDIMGPFAFIPFMECNHGIISLYHSVVGNLVINNKKIDFNSGYIEKDWGSSFPKNYIWLQSNDFEQKKCCIMVSIADIPFIGLDFKGCICIVLYKGKEYRLSTYNGVNIIRYDNKKIILKQGDYYLDISIIKNSPKELLAPNDGYMGRKVNEILACKARFRFYIKNNLLFDLESTNTSFEYDIFGQLL